MKHLIMIGCLAIGTLFAAETSLMDVTQWKSPYPKAVIQQKGDAITITGGTEMRSQKVFAIDPDALYKISFKARTTPAKGSVIASLNMRTIDKKQLYVHNYVYKAGSFTEIVADAPKGSTTIKVKDISQWNKSVFKNIPLALDAKEDYSDLPNFKILTIGIKNATKEKDHYVLELIKPTAIDLRAGTKVRQHYFGGACYYMGFTKLNSEWTEYSFHVEGFRKPGQSSGQQFPAKAAAFSLDLHFPWTGKGQVMEVKDIKIVEE